MDKLWIKKGKQVQIQEGGGSAADSLATIRRSGTMAGSAGRQLHQKPHRDVRMLQEQLQSVQIQLQEKHNELNYFKVGSALNQSSPRLFLLLRRRSMREERLNIEGLYDLLSLQAHCEELEREISRMRLQIALKDEEIADMQARLDAAGISALTPRMGSELMKSSESASPTQTPKPFAKAEPLRPKKPTWVVGVGNRESKRLSMLWKDTTALSAQLPASASSARDSSLDLAISKAVLDSPALESRTGIGAVLDAQLEAVERERRNSKTTPVDPIQRKDYDTYRCDLEQTTSTTKNQSISAPSDATREKNEEDSSKVTSPDTPPSSTTDHQQDSSSSSQKRVRLDADADAESAFAKLSESDPTSESSITGNETTQARRRSTRGRSLSVDWSRNAQILNVKETNEAEDVLRSNQEEEESKEEDNMFDESPGENRTKRRSWVKAGSPWREDDPSVAEAKWAKRKSLSALRLLKEENRKGFAYKVCYCVRLHC